MMDWEDIQVLNAKTEGQDRSLLEHLISIGAASPLLLEEISEELHLHEQPHVAHICQIPLVFNLDTDRYRVPSWYAGEYVELNFRKIYIQINPDGTQSVYPACKSQKRKALGHITQATQLVSFLKLEGKRRELYPKYLKCLQHTTFTDEVIGNSGSWLHVKPSVISSDVPLTAKVFENDLAIRCRKEVSFCLSKFLKAYGLSQLQELPIFPYLYGSFTMVAPGRISGGGAPKPLVAALGELINPIGRDNVTNNQIDQYLTTINATHDRVVSQVLSMSGLIEKGEMELAIVGCVSAIEWYINERFPKFVSKKGMSSSLNKILSDTLFSNMSKDFEAEIRSLAELRNSIVHGEPPTNNKSRKKTMGDRANAALHLTLKLLRYVNGIEKNNF